MKLYLAGPMRNIKDYNFPAFHAAAAALRALGHEVVSPAEMDLGDPELDPANLSPEEVEGKFRRYMARDLVAVLASEGVVLLPGWKDSTGALMEATVAGLAGIPLFQLVERPAGVTWTRPLDTHFLINPLMAKLDSGSAEDA